MGPQSPAHRAQRGYENQTHQKLDVDYRITGWRRTNVIHLWLFLRLRSKVVFSDWEHGWVRGLDRLFLRTCSRESRGPFVHCTTPCPPVRKGYWMEGLLLPGRWPVLVLSPASYTSGTQPGSFKQRWSSGVPEGRLRKSDSWRHTWSFWRWRWWWYSERVMTWALVQVLAWILSSDKLPKLCASVSLNM